MALNLRAGLFSFPGPLYSVAFQWGTDVPIGTGILGLENPSGSSKSLYVTDCSVGGYNSAASRQVTFQLRRSSVRTSGTVLEVSKFNSSSPNSVASAYGGGSWVLTELLRSITLNLSAGSAYEPIDLISPVVINQGERLVIVFSQESGTQTFLPSASITWYEL